MWDKFYNLACTKLDQNLKITDNFEVTRYMMGICDQPKIDNTYFVGNCFGTMTPGLGFGQYASILSGVFSGLDICKEGSYEDLTKPLFENYNHSLALRRFFDNLTDDQIDFAVKNLDTKIMSEVVDKICSKNSSIDLLKLSTPFMKLWSK